MNKKFKVYIFDLDDTLYNEREYVKQAFSNVANYLAGYSDKDSEYFYSSIIKALEQDGRGRIFNRIIDENKLVEDEHISVNRLVDVYRDTKPVLSLYDDAKVLIHTLRQDREIRLGIITDGCSRVQHNKIDGLGIALLFDKIIVTDDLENGAKPSAIPYQIFLDTYRDVKPCECVYIGDNPTKDFVGAKALGMYTIRIVREFGDNMKLVVDDELEADERIKLLTDICGGCYE